MNTDLIKRVKREILDLSPLAILIFKPDMELVFINSKVPKWTGYGEEELLGKKLFDLPFIPRKGGIFATDTFFKRLEGSEIPSYDFPIIAKNGQALVGSINGVVLRNDAKQISGILFMISNVTEKAKIKYLYEALVNTSPDSITATDVNGIITVASEESARLHGVKSPSDLIGKNALELISEKDRDRAKANMKKTWEKGTIKNVVYEMKRADGTTFMGELNASVIRNLKGQITGFVATVRDISKRLESENALLKQSEELKKLNSLMVDRELKMIQLKEKLREGTSD